MFWYAVVAALLVAAAFESGAKLGAVLLLVVVFGMLLVALNRGTIRFPIGS